MNFKAEVWRKIASCLFLIFSLKKPNCWEALVVTSFSIIPVISPAANASCRGVEPLSELRGSAVPSNSALLFLVLEILSPFVMYGSAQPPPSPSFVWHERQYKRQQECRFCMTDLHRSVVLFPASGVCHANSAKRHSLDLVFCMRNGNEGVVHCHIMSFRIIRSRSIPRLCNTNFPYCTCTE